MGKISIVIAFLFPFSISGQETDSNLCFRVMHDPIHAFGDYPSPPELSSELFADVMHELSQDSARYYFSCLSRDSMFKTRTPHEPLEWFFNHRHHGLLMACVSHWNPDIRIKAVRKLAYWKMIRPMICTTREQYEKMEQQDMIIFKHLIFVFDSNPLSIPGSENSTLHHIFMKELLIAIDYYSGEKILQQMSAEKMLLNEPSLSQAMLKWKSHLK
jgi:hypothetical protein